MPKCKNCGHSKEDHPYMTDGFYESNDCIICECEYFEPQEEEG